MIRPAPFAYRHRTGSPANYFIHDGYQCRLDNAQFDDTPFTDEYQNEVYEYARQVADDWKLRGVMDVGCGSGFKLMKFFQDFDTLGCDTAATVKFLRAKWSLRRWKVCDFNAYPDFYPQLIICADVLEHLREPTAMLQWIKHWYPKRIVLSTPERDELCLGTHDGPPKNLHHVREWNFTQMHAYIGQHFTIRQHFVLNGVQIVEAE